MTFEEYQAIKADMEARASDFDAEMAELEEFVSELNAMSVEEKAEFEASSKQFNDAFAYWEAVEVINRRLGEVFA